MERTVVTWIDDRAGDAYIGAQYLAYTYNLRLHTIKCLRGIVGNHLIIVAHRSLGIQYLDYVVQELLYTRFATITLAFCCSGVIMNANERLSPSQYIANKLKCIVIGTLRVLTVEEVARGRIFLPTQRGLVHMGLCWIRCSPPIQ